MDRDGIVATVVFIRDEEMVTHGEKGYVKESFRVYDCANGKYYGNVVRSPFLVPFTTLGLSEGQSNDH